MSNSIISYDLTHSAINSVVLKLDYLIAGNQSYRNNNYSTKSYHILCINQVANLGK